jgi:L-amino acid N-acyltransferase YncA
MVLGGIGGADHSLNMKTFHLRDAVLDDSHSIARIYEHYVRTTCFTFEEVPPTPDEITTRMSRIIESGLPYCVAEGTDGSVIGYVYASSFHTRSAYRYSLENSVYVASAQTGQGIGTALMENLIRRCTALGYRQMVALIGDKENGASVRLHTRLGFKPVGNLSSIGLKFNRWIDVFEMQLALGDGPRTIPTDDPIKTPSN